MMFYRSITKDKSKTNNRLVILSGENCKAVGVVELPRVERERTSKEQKNTSCFRMDMARSLGGLP